MIPNLTFAYFSNGLKQPPTSLVQMISRISIGRDFEGGTMQCIERRSVVTSSRELLRPDIATSW